MTVTAIVSQKGGVGKTTLALNLAFALSRMSLRVVLVDVDPQGAVGHSLTGAVASQGLAGVLAKRVEPEQALLRTRLSELSILPVGEVLPHKVHDYASELADGAALVQVCRALSASADLVLIDTPSGFGGATLGAMRAAQYVISPLQAEPMALKTLPQLLSVVGALREQGTNVSLVAVVLSMLQPRNSESLAVAEEVWTRLPPDLVLETTIPRDASVLSASAAGVPLGLLSRLRPPPISLVFDQLASELSTRLGLVSEGEDGPVGLFA